jgi:hypothetical protein
MTHKDAPERAPDQLRFETYYRARWEQESVYVAMGRDRNGRYFAVSTQIAWETWQEAQKRNGQHSGSQSEKENH